jgi:hypothetical protein
MQELAGIIRGHRYLEWAGDSLNAFLAEGIGKMIYYAPRSPLFVLFGLEWMLNCPITDWRFLISKDGREARLQLSTRYIVS